MSDIINAGTATFTNGSTTVSFTGADFFSKGALSTKQRITQRFYLGDPVQTAKFGYLKWSCAAQIDYFAYGTDGGAPDNALTADLEINGVNQSINLVLSAGSKYNRSSAQTLTV